MPSTTSTMNRLASAFSNVPSIHSDSSNPPKNSPLETSFTSRSDDHIRKRSSSPHAALYDDPRQIHYPDGSWSNQNLVLPRRPNLMRHNTDDALSRSATPRPKGKERDDGTEKAVKVNLLDDSSGAKRGWGMSILPGSGRITAMAQGPDGKYAVGGGQYLKVLQVKAPSSGASTPLPQVGTQEVLAKGIGGATIVETTNLWRSQWGVNKGVNDVDWGTGTMAAKIVSACPSGNILIFDVTKGKLEKEVSGGHPRPMNVVRACKTPSHTHWLFTGGLEGQAKIWDLRERDPAVKKFFKTSIAITSIALHPDNPQQFLVGQETGSILRYDVRNPMKVMGRIWGAHGNRPVTDLKWKTGSEGGWLASAGADRTVQIWDMSNTWEKPTSPTHTLHTAYPLRKIQWRPGHDTEIAIVPSFQNTSSSSVDPKIGSIPQGLGAHPAHPYQIDLDPHIEIWDVRRHHVAKYAVASSDGAAIALEWSDDNTIMTAHQNGMFVQADIRPSSKLPLEDIPRNVMGWNARGELAYAIDRFKSGEVPFDDLRPEYSSHWDKVGQRQKSISDDPYEPLQAVGIMPPIDPANESYLDFVAHGYRLEGHTPEYLCWWNAEVAESCERLEDARFWSFLRLYIEEFSERFEDPDGLMFTNPFASKSNPATTANLSPRGSAQMISQTPKPIPLKRLDENLDVEHLDLSASSSSASSCSSDDDSTDKETTPAPHRSRFLAFAPPDNRRLSESLTITSIQSPALTAIPAGNNSVRTTPRTLFAQVIGQSGARTKQRSGSSTSNSHGYSDYPDPYGVVPGTPPSNRMSASRILVRPGEKNFTSLSGSSKASPNASKRPSPHINANSNLAAPPRASIGDAALEQTRQAEYIDSEWSKYKRQRAETVLEWWRCYVNDGEVQLATSAFVIGRGHLDFPEVQSERIVHAYLDILEAHRLPGVAAYVRRYCGISSMEIRGGDEGITHIVNCARCRKSTGAVDIPLSQGKFWWCKNCKRPAKTCVVCHQAVKGLWMGCGKCKHGGHQKCLRLYYSNAELRLATVEPVSGAAMTPKPSRTHRQSPPITPMGTSNESSGFDKGRTSSDTVKDPVIPEERKGLRKGWNVCAKGCGCKCRIVVSALATAAEDA